MKLKNVALLNWPPQNKSVTCPSLKPIQKNWQEDKFTCDPTKCDFIFDEFLKNGYIKLSHALPSLEELKRRSYSKWHNYFLVFLMRLMIVMFSFDGSNSHTMRDE